MKIDKNCDELNLNRRERVPELPRIQVNLNSL